MITMWKTECVCGDLGPHTAPQQLNMNLAFSAIGNIITQTFKRKLE